MTKQVEAQTVESQAGCLEEVTLKIRPKVTGVFKKQQVGGAQKGKRVPKTSSVLSGWCKRMGRVQVARAALTHTPGQHNQGFRNRCHVQICS